MQIIKLTSETRKNILEQLLKRSPDSYQGFEERVNAIVEQVREKGDEAVFGYTKQFDGVEVSAQTVRVTKKEIDEAYQNVEPGFLDVVRKALVNIRSYHEKQRKYSWFDSTENGTMLGQKVTPLATVGVYVPGGKAVYPSSVLMNVVPAKVAGVPRIVMTTPPGKDGRIPVNTLIAANEAGVDEIYKVGGAQAIAALAFGTGSIPKADKITGPGNIYVALAKKAVFGHVSIDSVAGPSEILVLADETANPRYVAADLLSQAEHDEMASAILVTRGTCTGGLERDRGIPEDAVPRGDHSEVVGTVWIHPAGGHAGRRGRDGQRDRLRASGDRNEGRVSGDDEDPQRRRDLYRRVQQRASGRLLCGAEPCASDERHSKIFLCAVRGRLH